MNMADLVIFKKVAVKLQGLAIVSCALVALIACTSLYLKA